MDRQKFNIKNCGNRWGKTNDEYRYNFTEMASLKLIRFDETTPLTDKLISYLTKRLDDENRHDGTDALCYSLESNGYYSNKILLKDFEKEYLMKFQEVNEKESFIQKV